MNHPLHQDLTPEELLAEQFFDLYKGLDRAYGRYTLGGGKDEKNKQKGQAKTIHGTYNVKLWNMHLEGKQGLGVVPIQEAATCWWGAIDIDEYPLDLVALETKVRELKLPLLVIRTKSGGAHLTCFFSEPVPCKVVRQKLFEFMMALGYANLEIFPKQIMLAGTEDTGNWLNMPYFNYKDTNRYCIFKGEPISAAQFIDLANMVRVSEEQFERCRPEEEDSQFKDGPPCLQMLARAKTPQGTRNIVLFNMSTYAKKKYGEDFGEHVEQMNQDYITPPLTSEEVAGVKKNQAKKDYGYQCGNAPLIGCCNRDECKKREFGISTGGEDLLPVIDSITKIETEPPRYIVEIEGKRLQCDPNQLQNIRLFSDVLFQHMNVVLPDIKNHVWKKVLREKMGALQIIEAPEDTKTSGLIVGAVRKYLAGYLGGRKKEEVARGMPWADPDTGRIYINGANFQRYVQQTLGMKESIPQMWATLVEHGVRGDNIPIGGQIVPVWSLPASMAPEQKVQTPDLPDNEF